MKNKIGFGLLVALVGGLSLSVVNKPVQANPQPARREVVILQGTPGFVRLTPSTFIQPDVVIITSSSSAGAPQFPPYIHGSDPNNNITGTSVAEAIAQLLSLGYRIEKADVGATFNYLLVK